MAELMPDDFSMFAIDLPGNGLSSHIPPMQNYFFIDVVSVVRRIKMYFGWDKVDLLGHSGGSNICFYYASIFPEDVKSYFGIDFLTHNSIDDSRRASEIVTLIDR